MARPPERADCFQPSNQGLRQIGSPMGYRTLTTPAITPEQVPSANLTDAKPTGRPGSGEEFMGPGFGIVRSFLWLILLLAGGMVGLAGFLSWHFRYGCNRGGTGRRRAPGPSLGKDNDRWHHQGGSRQVGAAGRRWRPAGDPGRYRLEYGAPENRGGPGGKPEPAARDRAADRAGPEDQERRGSRSTAVSGEDTDSVGADSGRANSVFHGCPGA